MHLETLPLGLKVLLSPLTSFENRGTLLVGAIGTLILTRLDIFGGFRCDARLGIPLAAENFHEYKCVSFVTNKSDLMLS